VSSASAIEPQVREWLRYLEEMGFAELYLPAAATAPAGAASAARPARPVPAAVQARAAAPPRAAERVAAATAPLPAAEPLPPLPALAVEGAVAGESELDALCRQAQGCTRCRLANGRQKVVFGAGDPQARLMFIGEGPGAEEDRTGLPFVGAAGQLLDRIIQAIDLSREQVYIANVVKCRPPGNRDPQPDEVAACRGYLERQVDLIRPEVIVTLGRVAAQTLLGNDLPIGRMRGQWFQSFGLPTMVTYHPAALLRNPALKRPTWEDLQQVRDRLQGA
jgi:uracil-DNA glycosylase family 4